jgi:phosphoesterase RecJ-like protein
LRANHEKNLSIPPLSLREFKELIQNARTILLSTHQLPDGDGLGAQTALYHFLKQAGKEVKVCNPDDIPERYQFLDPHRSFIHHSSPSEMTWDLWIILDTNDPRRLGPLWTQLPSQVKKMVFLDHHTDLTPNTPITIPQHAGMISNPQLSSIGELLYEVFESSTHFHLTPEIALGLYVSIMTDTNSFRTAQTTPQAHRIASITIEHGVKPEEVYQAIYSSKETSHLKLLGHLLQNIEESSDGRIAWMKLDRPTRQRYQAQADDTLSFLNLLLLIRDAEIICFFREEDHGQIRVSIKSKGRVVVNTLAMQLGGGGHEYAAGVALTCTLSEAVAIVIAKIQAQLSLTHSLSENPSSEDFKS